MDIQALERLVKGRRSVRQWTKEEVSNGLLKRAVELATWAPNGGNYQAWRFIIVKNRDVIERAANVVQSVADKIASWPEGRRWKEEIAQYRQNASFFRNAPVCIGVFIPQYQSVMDKVLMARESFDDAAKEILSYRRSAPIAVQSAAAAVTTMLLTFHQMGLGAVWLGVPLFARNEIEALLKVTESYDLVCLVAVGYSNESLQKERKPVEQVMEFIE